MNFQELTASENFPIGDLKAIAGFLYGLKELKNSYNLSTDQSDAIVRFAKLAKENKLTVAQMIAQSRTSSEPNDDGHCSSGRVEGRAFDQAKRIAEIQQDEAVQSVRTERLNAMAGVVRDAAILFGAKSDLMAGLHGKWTPTTPMEEQLLTAYQTVTDATQSLHGADPLAQLGWVQDADGSVILNMDKITELTGFTPLNLLGPAAAPKLRAAE